MHYQTISIRKPQATSCFSLKTAYLQTMGKKKGTKDLPNKYIFRLMKANVASGLQCNYARVISGAKTIN